MTRPRIRALLLADTHLGFDLPARPRIERRRRGPEFFEAPRRALAPVIYPGAIQRTSFAERREVKGFCRLELVPGAGGGRLARHRFIALPSRPMIRLDLDEADLEEEALAARLAALPSDAIVKLHLRDGPREPPVIRAATLRALARPTMNVELAWPHGARR